MNKPQWKPFITDENHPDFSSGINERSEIQMFEQKIIWRDAKTKEIFSEACHQNHNNKENGLEFLITQKHPYHEELQLWAITQMPVYYQHREYKYTGECNTTYTASNAYYPFSRPDIFEYSFTPFKS